MVTYEAAIEMSETRPHLHAHARGCWQNLWTVRLRASAPQWLLAQSHPQLPSTSTSPWSSSLQGSCLHQREQTRECQQGSVCEQDRVTVSHSLTSGVISITVAVFHVLGNHYVQLSHEVSCRSRQKSKVAAKSSHCPFREGKLSQSCYQNKVVW